jgi:hypothetical protein
MEMKRIDRAAFWGIPALFLLAAVFHFLYGWSGQSPAVGLLAPVNESVFEHMKMMALPAALWWGLWGLKTPRPGAWYTAGLAAAVTSALAVPLLFYGYTGALGRESFAADLLITLLAIGAGQLLGRHLLRRSRGIPAPAALLLTACLLSALALLTLFPPQIPLFRDAVSGTYGLLRAG